MRPIHPNGLGTEALKRMMQRPEHLLFPSSPCHTRGMISSFLPLQFSGVVCVPSFEFTSHVIMYKVSLLCLDVSGVIRIAQFRPRVTIFLFYFFLVFRDRVSLCLWSMSWN